MKYTLVVVDACGLLLGIALVLMGVYWCALFHRRWHWERPVDGSTFSIALAVMLCPGRVRLFERVCLRCHPECVPEYEAWTLVTGKALAELAAAAVNMNKAFATLGEAFGHTSRELSRLTRLTRR